ncbi:antibiotic biosynthesis monooxygenase family protein [Halomonas sp. M20]|uniref:antibiotic biosynthesis monooxygenase family protein n=1 Tax=Halomonas sp. M20 TaxID=2763264 RepID=UPI001D0A498D|nr:antibiotic biosynthesis monooxygenase [Halomonas sp. M20]
MVKIIIERRIMHGLEEEYEQAAREVVRAAMSAPGFIAGESLQEYQRSEHRLLITLWRDLRAWKEWQRSSARAHVMQRLLPLLTEEERVTAYEHP